jgi:hypothetical protein
MSNSASLASMSSADVAGLDGRIDRDHFAVLTARIEKLLA